MPTNSPPNLRCRVSGRLTERAKRWLRYADRLALLRRDVRDALGVAVSISTTRGLETHRAGRTEHLRARRWFDATTRAVRSRAAGVWRANLSGLAQDRWALRVRDAFAFASRAGTSFHAH